MNRIRDRIAAGIFIALVIASTVGVTWLLRQTYVVYKLRRGVGEHPHGGVQKVTCLPVPVCGRFRSYV